MIFFSKKQWKKDSCGIQSPRIPRGESHLDVCEEFHKNGDGK